MAKLRFALCLFLAIWASACLATTPIAARDVDFLGNHPMRNFERLYPEIEVDWDPSNPDSAPAISIDIDGNLSVTFQHHNASDKSGTGTFHVTYAELELPDLTTVQLLVNGQSSASGSVSIPADGDFWSPTFQISGWDPCIHAGTLRIGYIIDTTSIPGLTGLVGNRQWRFLVNLEPPVGHMQTVWHELLEESTAYAWGEDQAILTAGSLTFGLFNSNRFLYADFPHKRQWINDNFHFELTRFIREGANGRANCHDVAVYLSMLFETQGLPNDPVQRNCEPGPYGLDHFVTNLICPIGNPPSLGSSYTTIYWKNHCIVVFDGLVYDACLALQLAPDFSAYFGPPAAWSLPNHWYKSHGTSFTGIAKRFLTPTEFLTGIIDLSQNHESTRAIDVTYPFGGPV